MGDSLPMAFMLTTLGRSDQGETFPASPPGEHPALGLVSIAGGFIIFFAAAILAVTSITEFAVREQVLTLLRAEQEKVRERLFRQTVTSATFKANQILVDGAQSIAKDKEDAAAILTAAVKLDVRAKETARKALTLASEARDKLQDAGLPQYLIGTPDDERSAGPVAQAGVMPRDDKALAQARDLMAAARQANAESKDLQLAFNRETERASERSRQATERQASLFTSALQQLDRGRLEAESDQTVRDARERKIQRLEALETALRGVIVGGDANASFIVKAAFQELGRGDTDDRKDGSRQATEPNLGGVGAAPLENGRPPLIRLQSLLENIPTRPLSSDLHLSIAIIACGILGAFIAELRSGRRQSVRNFMLGLAAGFVSLLAMRGGKHVLLVEPLGGGSSFNPYAVAFVGLLAGLFTERAYNLLSDLVDALIKRIKKVTSEDGSPPASPPTPPPSASAPRHEAAVDGGVRRD